MKTAFTSIVITPPLGVPLAGNARTDARAVGTYDDLRANYAYVESAGAEWLLIGLDLIGLAQAEMDAIKARIHQATGLAIGNITIAATHTHSGPNTMEIFPELLSEEEQKACHAYVDWLVQAVAGEAPALLQKAEEGLVAFGRDVVEGYSFCRRIVMKDGSFKMVFEDYDPAEIDHIAGPNGYPVMNLFLFTGPDESVKGVVVNFTSHPAVVCGEGLLYCRDYIGPMTDALQRRYGKDVVVVYANGAQGNLVAADPYKPFITGFEEAGRVGRGLAAGAQVIIDRLLMERQFEAEPPLLCKTAPLTLPLRKVTAAEVEQAKAVLAAADENTMQLHGLDPKVEARSVLQMAALTDTEETTLIQAVRFGDALIVTFPGEVFFQFAQQVIRHSPVKNTMVFGLANAMVGYLPTEEAFGQGGYEIKPSVSSSRFAPAAGGLLAEACCRLVDEMAADGGTP